MRTLTLRQPTPSLVISGAQWVVVRDQPTSYRGEVMLHAAKAPPAPDLHVVGRYLVGQWSWDVDMADAMDHMDSVDCSCGDWEDGDFDPSCAASFTWQPALLNDEGAHGLSLAMTLPLGAVVGVADLVDCVPIADGDDEAACMALLEAGVPHLQSVLDDGDGWLDLHHPELGPHGDLWTGWSIPDQAPFGDFTPGRWAWIFSNPCRAHVPDVRGRGGLWTPDDDLQQRTKEVMDP